MERTKNGAVKLDFDGQGIATLTLEMSGRANKINQEFGDGFAQGLTWAKGQQGLKGIIVATGHKDFCVGADIDMLYQARDPKRFYEQVRALQTGYRQLETCGVPVVAALTGSALGGGFELALSCHRRIALDDPKIQLGLPEVMLGVLPGGGGTQRILRMVGLQAAADLILPGKTLRPQTALEAKIIDEVCATPEAVRAAAVGWILAHPGAKQPWDEKSFKFPPPVPGTTDFRDFLLAGSGMLYKKTAGAFRAPELVLRCFHEGGLLELDRALEVEARHFVNLAVGDQAKDMLRTLWYHRTAAEKHEGLPSTDQEGIQKVGILGAGMMGAALAWQCASVGYDVVVRDIKDEVLQKAMDHCRELTKEQQKRLGEEGAKALLARISTTVAPEPLKGCDLVIEAVFEDLELKHRVTKEIEPLLAPGGIWASNTSALPITDLARASAHADRFIGLHFFSPVDKMPLLVIIMGKETSQETAARCLSFCRKIKKTPILINDGYGFYTTRVFLAYLMQGVQLVAEGHDPAVVEWGARAAGMVVGPLQVFDEVTLTLVRKAAPQAKKYGRAVEGPGIDLLIAMVDEHKRYGKAAGAGFYDYEAGKRKGLWPGLKALAKGTPTATGADVVGQRLLLAQCVEAARVMEEGILQRKRDAEVGAIFGLGFAPNTGGPLSCMDRMGIPTVVKELEALAAAYGPHFTPPKLLVAMAEKGERFFEVV
ncbi:MAG: enoyl-CoA hydratase/isomerase family protein [Deltaproteobacteria bacterium]|nr:enoyl-CoA hydratase/isomerase family protein [Deltaproteobacteria bacterium]